LITSESAEFVVAKKFMDLASTSAEFVNPQRRPNENSA